VTRFDREQTNEGLPTSLGTVTDELKSSVERQLRQIVEVAESRAAAIEDAALRKAADTEREAAARAEDLFRSGSDRATAMLETIDLLESEIGVVMSALRSEAQSLKSELDARGALAASGPQGTANASTASEPATVERAEGAPALPPAEGQPRAPAPQTTAAPIAEATPAPAAPAAPQDEITAAPPQPEIPAAVPPEAPAGDGTPALDEREMVRAQIVAMLHSGKPRAEAEAALMRLKQGSHYIDLLDEVYARGPNVIKEPPRRRRGILGWLD
jgi:hypothetical protein